MFKVNNRDTMMKRPILACILQYLHQNTEPYSEPSQTSKMKRFDLIPLICRGNDRNHRHESVKQNQLYMVHFRLVHK